MAWLGVKKAIDFVPHDWISHYLRLFGAHDRIIKFLESAMSTELMVNGLSLGKEDIKCGSFQGDKLSPLLFITSLAPLSFILDNISKGYHLSNSSTIIKPSGLYG